MREAEIGKKDGGKRKLGIPVIEQEELYEGRPSRTILWEHRDFMKLSIRSESKHMTQEDLGKIISKKRSYISRVENDGSNMNLKTLYDIVEKGLGGKVNIAIEI